VRFITLPIVLVGTISLATGLSIAQDTWLADPGRGVGPLVLGMPQQDVIALIGQPSSISDISMGQYLLGKTFRYNALGLNVEYGIDPLAPDSNRDFRLVTRIDVWGLTMRTRGNISNGSSGLADVVRVFGDSSQFTGDGSALRQCVFTQVLQDSSTGDVSLVLNYLQQGIVFYFSSVGRLRRMIIQRVTQCMSVLSK